MSDNPDAEYLLESARLHLYEHRMDAGDVEATEILIQALLVLQAEEKLSRWRQPK